MEQRHEVPWWTLCRPESSLISGTRSSSGWEVAVTLTQHTLLRAGNGKTVQIRTHETKRTLLPLLLDGGGKLWLGPCLIVLVREVVME